MKIKTKNQSVKSATPIWIPTGELFQFNGKVRPHHPAEIRQLSSELGFNDDEHFFFLTQIGSELYLLPACYPRTVEELRTDVAKLYFLYHLCEKFQNDTVLTLAPHKDSDVKLVGDFVTSNRKKYSSKPQVEKSNTAVSSPDDEVIGPGGDSIGLTRLNSIRKSPVALNHLLSTLLQNDALTKDSILVKNHDKEEFNLTLSRDGMLFKGVSGSGPEEALSWDQIGQVGLKRAIVTVPVFRKLNPRSILWSFVPTVKGSATNLAGKYEGIADVVLHLPDKLSATRLCAQIQAIQKHCGNLSTGHEIDGARPVGMLSRLNHWARNSLSCISPRRAKRSQSTPHHHRSPSPKPPPPAEVTVTLPTDPQPASPPLDTYKFGVNSEKEYTHISAEDKRGIVSALAPSRAPTAPTYHMGIKPTMPQPVASSPPAQSPRTTSQSVCLRDPSPMADKHHNRETDSVMFDAMKCRMKTGLASEESTVKEEPSEDRSALLSTFVSSMSTHRHSDYENPDSLFTPLNATAELHGPQVKVSTYSERVITSSVVATGNATPSAEASTPPQPVPALTVGTNPQPDLRPAIIGSNLTTESPVTSTDDGPVFASHAQIDSNAAKVSNGLDTSKVEHALVKPSASVTTSSETTIKVGRQISNEGVSKPSAQSSSGEPSPSVVSPISSISVVSTSTAPPVPPHATAQKQPASPVSSTTEVGLPSPMNPTTLHSETVQVSSSTHLSGSPTVSTAQITLPGPTTTATITKYESTVTTTSVGNTIPVGTRSLFAPTPYPPQTGIRPPIIKPLTGGPSPDPPRRSTVSRLPSPGAVPSRSETNGTRVLSSPPTSSPPLVYNDPEPTKDLTRSSVGSAIKPPEGRVSISGIRPPSVSVKANPCPEQPRHQSFIRPPSTAPSMHIQLGGGAPPTNGNGVSSPPSALKQPMVMSTGLPTSGMHSGIRPPSQMPRPTNTR